MPNSKKSSTDLPFACTCGTFRGSIRDPKAAFTKRAVCYCRDCRAFPLYLGRGKEILDENGGSEVLPTYPSHIQITDGAGHLKCIRLADDGMIRWYADCCKTPVANTMPMPKLPFASLHPILFDSSLGGKTRDEAIGPVYARINARYGYGTLPKDAHRDGSFSHLCMVLGFFLIGFLKGRQQPSPFFTKEGKTTSEPLILSRTEAEYEKLLADLGT